MSPSFEQLLNVFWLRPETALWREIDIRAMGTFRFRSPSLDLGCGDGIFSFIRAGGAFEDRFDAFRAVTDLKGFFDKADVFDAFDDSAPPPVRRRPTYGIDVGLDHKKNLLSKARKLDFYGEVRVADANQGLPFEDRSFNTVFSNIVYWLADPAAAISEVARVLKPGGQACLMLPNQTLPHFSFYKQLYLPDRNPEWAFLEKLDRGRFADNIREARAAEAWEMMFKDSELKVVAHARHLSKTVVQIWDIGLRPLFPALHRMAASIEPDTLLPIKREWVQILRQFLEPLIDGDARLNQGVEPAFHCYVLER